MYDIITFGSASLDIFIKPKEFIKIKNKKKFTTGKGVCFDIGSKVDIDKIFFASGGGGTNTATTFAKQGFKVAFCGKLGDDIAGKKIIEELKKNNIDINFVFFTKKASTNHSIVLTGFDKDRMIFVFRGASELLKKEEIPFSKLKAKWLYLAPLSGKLCDSFEILVDYAYKNNIKLAVNPGHSQLSLPFLKLKRIIQKINVFILNQEEAAFLAKMPFQKEKEIFEKIDNLCPNIFIMTKGDRGAVISDKKYFYSIKAPKTKVVDKTGAGDAFASGFLSGFILKNGDVDYSISLAISNAVSCLKKIGAKNGLLEKNGRLIKIKIDKKRR